MTQIFLILGITGLIYLYFLYKKKDQIKKKDSEEMIRCKQCGVNVPISKAFKSGDNWFCSEDHKKI